MPPSAKTQETSGPVNYGDIFRIRLEDDFREICLRIFRYQSVANPVYKAYLHLLGVDPKQINHIQDIPFLPVSAFRNHRVVTGTRAAEQVFESSTTTGQQPSRHYVCDMDLYRQSLVAAFQRAYGDPSQYCLLALLPSYLERGNSSLIHMVQHLMHAGNHPGSAFLPADLGEASRHIAALDGAEEKVLLLGVSYALLDLAEQFPMPLSHTLIMETGGMKGRREECTREQLHTQLCRAFGQDRIHSEYGMTELLSQAYSKGEGVFESPPWMRIGIREIHDPFSFCAPGKQGAVNVTDLANVHSCSFLATDDLGRVHNGHTFEITGRLDGSEIRGCSLLYTG